jgi:hypothetical protein
MFRGDANGERHRTAICSLPADIIIKRMPTVVMVIVSWLMRTVRAWHNRAVLLDLIQVAARSNIDRYRVLLLSEAWVCGRSLAGNAGSNLARVMDVCLS